MPLHPAAKRATFVRFPLVFVIACGLLGDVITTVEGNEPTIKPARTHAVATIETTLSTSGKQIRQLAFDGDDKTFFATAKNPESADHFTLVFDQPVAVRSIAVFTGRPDESDKLEQGTLEISPDGTKFHSLSKFVSGSASEQAIGQSRQPCPLQRQLSCDGGISGICG